MDNSEECPPYLYHGTCMSRLESIQETGLDPRYGGQNWAQSEHAVYLTRKPSAAASFAEGDEENERDEDDEFVVLRVATSELDRAPLVQDRYIAEHFPNNKDHFQYGALVPAANLTLVYPSGEVCTLGDFVIPTRWAARSSTLERGM